MGEIEGRGYDRPWTFYALSTAIPFALWGIAAWLSHRPDQGEWVRLGTAVFGLTGLAAPAVVAAWLVRDQPRLRVDVLDRLWWARGTRWTYLACAGGLLLASLLAATAVSVALGYSPDQFRLRGGFTFTSGVLPVWVVLLLAPVLEELAWHSYGTDALLSRMRLFTASILFTVFWALWHAPLALIRGYYHSNVAAQGWLQELNFPLSMIPFVLIMNWLYFRTGRSIAVAALFHLTAGFVNEIFLTHPDTKVIQTALLLPFAAAVVWRERELFFGRPGAPEAALVPQVAQ